MWGGEAPPQNRLAIAGRTQTRIVSNSAKMKGKGQGPIGPIGPKRAKGPIGPIGPSWLDLAQDYQRKAVKCQKNVFLGWIWLKTTREGCKVSKKRKTWLDLA